VTEYLTITGAAAGLRAGEVTAVELVDRAVRVADAHDAAVGTFIDRYADAALAAAERADATLAGGAPVGPLHGIPLGIKDIITTADGPSTAQSLVLDPAWGPAIGDAPVAARLRAAGGIFVGKSTTMEFAIGFPDPAKPFPIPRNPWQLDAWAGGSSSGTGSGVAAGMFLGGLGTDTGGSIRIPAAYCGISGLMPTFGRVPKSGCVPLGYSLDHIGPMARSAADCALMLGVLAGYDPSDACAVDLPVPDYPAALTGDLTGLRIGVDRLDRFAGADEDPALPAVFEAALAELRAAGAELVPVELPYYQEMTVADMVTMLAEALAYHAPDLRGRWSDYFEGTRRIIGMGAFFTAADYVQAQRVRRVAQQALAELYREVDLVVTPTASRGASPIGEGIGDFLTGGGMRAVHTGYWDSVGNPVLSVPMGFTGTGLPLGLQVAGRPFDEATVLRAGDAFQRRTDWHLRVPELVRTPSVAV
jgi:aspartyl-tRNA(Asn)/glutamyl-tRNA(Gln) amidotransferase subunit A